MASSVFYRFRHQKDLSRITFDGTGISVFELKRDVITQNKLGEGTDFELTLYTEEGDVYEDDTTIIPRSTTVITRRSPARQPHKGGAARYVSGRMPVNALSGKKAATSKAGPNGLQLQAPEAQTEEEKLSAIFQSGKQEWAKQQELLESSMPIRRPPNKADIPDKPPPPGYVCYRCGEKGHWIQACPTNDDPNYVSQPRFKRTTGIPKSMLVKVDKSDFDEEEERPAGLMLSADGDWVMAKSDYEEFRKYQAKVRQSKVAQQEEKQGSKELQERGLECPWDKRLFAEPMKTPCCQRTYCSECINNALIEHDLHCPNCKSDLLLDDLTVDEEKRAAVRAFEAERAERAKENAAANAAAQAGDLAQEVAKDDSGNNSSSNPTNNGITQAKDSIKPSIEPTDGNPSAEPDLRKRKADISLQSHREGSGPPPSAPRGPSTGSQQQQQQPQPQLDGNGQAMPGYQNPMMWNMGNPQQWQMNMQNMQMLGMDGMNGMNGGMQGMGNMAGWQQQQQAGGGGDGGGMQGQQQDEGWQQGGAADMAGRNMAAARGRRR